MRSPLPCLALAVALLAGGCGEDHAARDLAVGAGPGAAPVVVSEVYAAALRYYGAAAHVERVPDPIGTLDSGEVDVVPAFTGQVLQRFSPGAPAIQEASVYRAMVGALPEGVAAGDYATAAQDKAAAVVAESTATAWGGRDLSALVKHCGQLTAGAAAGAKPPATVGGCTLPKSSEFVDDTALFEALRTGRINLAWTTTADPDTPGDVVVLADRQPMLIPADNVVPLYRRNALSEREALALNQVAGELDTGELATMQRQVAGGEDPRQVAEEWLSSHPLGH